MVIFCFSFDVILIAFVGYKEKTLEGEKKDFGTKLCRTNFKLEEITQTSNLERRTQGSLPFLLILIAAN